jgi:predicted PurR-regulated permease PerM
MSTAQTPSTGSVPAASLLEPRNENAASRTSHALGATRWTVALLCLGAIIALLPLWKPLLLAAFVAIVAVPLYDWLSRKISGRSRAAAVLLALLAVFVFVPTLIAALSIYNGGAELYARLQKSSGAYDALNQLVSKQPQGGPDAGPWHLSASRALELARQHGMSALSAAQTVFGAAAAVFIGMFVFAFGFYEFLLNGRRGYAWLLKRSPIPRDYAVRLGSAFVETARGLLIGVGLTALIQGVIATIGYFALGVSQAAVLGLMTTFAALIPSIGTGLVWVPVTGGLLLAGRTHAAIILLAIGCVVSVSDNLVRPLLSRYGKLDMSTFLLLIAMLGGATAFGGFGLLLGPLFVRLAMEGLRVLHDERLDAPLNVDQQLEPDDHPRIETNAQNAASTAALTSAHVR